MPGRTKYVPVFSSQLSYSQNGALQPEQTPVPTAPLTQSQRDRPRSKLASTGPLKVKLPKPRKGLKKPDKTARNRTAEPVADTSVCREEAALNVHTGGWHANWNEHICSQRCPRPSPLGCLIFNYYFEHFNINIYHFNYICKKKKNNVYY